MTEYQDVRFWKHFVVLYQAREELGGLLLR
jgi:hypothetical protein